MRELAMGPVAMALEKIMAHPARLLFCCWRLRLAGWREMRRRRFLMNERRLGCRSGGRAAFSGGAITASCNHMGELAVNATAGSL
jgi:hypothetical protein